MHEQHSEEPLGSRLAGTLLRLPHISRTYGAQHTHFIHMRTDTCTPPQRTRAARGVETRHVHEHVHMDLPVEIEHVVERAVAQQPMLRVEGDKELIDHAAIG